MSGCKRTVANGNTGSSAATGRFLQRAKQRIAWNETMSCGVMLSRNGAQEWVTIVIIVGGGVVGRYPQAAAADRVRILTDCSAAQTSRSGGSVSYCICRSGCMYVCMSDGCWALALARQGAGWFVVRVMLMVTVPRGSALQYVRPECVPATPCLQGCRASDNLPYGTRYVACASHHCLRARMRSELRFFWLTRDATA